MSLLNKINHCIGEIFRCALELDDTVINVI